MSIVGFSLLTSVCLLPFQDSTIGDEHLTNNNELDDMKDDSPGPGHNNENLGEEEGMDIVEISNWRPPKNKKSGVYQLYVLMEGIEDGKHKKEWVWGNLDDVCADCQMGLTDNEKSKNLVVQYLNKLEIGKGTTDMMQKVGWLLRELPETLFRKYPTPERSVEATLKEGDDVSIEDAPPPVVCPNDHKNTFSYTEVDHGFYFKEGQKWYGLGCNECHKIFVNKNVGSDPTLIKPTTKEPVYVCNDFDKGHSTCNIILCHQCFVVKIIGIEKESTIKATTTMTQQEATTPPLTKAITPDSGKTETHPTNIATKEHKRIDEKTTKTLPEGLLLGTNCCYSKCQHQEKPILKQYKCIVCKQHVHPCILENSCSVAVSGEDDEVLIRCRDCNGAAV